MIILNGDATVPPNERLITHLRHVDLAVPDFGREFAFFTETWGLKAENTESGLAFLAAEGSPENYCVRLREADQKRIDLIAFGAATSADVDKLAQRLAADGVRLVTEPDVLKTPGGGYGFRFFDNDGRTIEVSSGVEVRRHRQVEEGESIPVRLSHVVVNTPNPEATVEFYRSHLGFAVSDTLMHPRMGEMMWFLRTNPFHHSLAIARGPHVALHHASFEMRGLDEYLRGTGRLLRAGVEKVWGPGRHTAGNNTFSYFLDPHGNTVEYTTELEQLDEDTWHPHLYDFTEPMVADQWGTANPMNELVASKSFNDPDLGVFHAPPI
ncbi:VOC family protein [Parafrankia sp. EUN1f]|uniref:VOC family protein n=1 Tax=Parafrankia sp. EUN1f TaxID=102897 RepID=UPI0001C445EA|nr:VOC family protein [Parafrankia sp. EUN1f]EFC86742.1 Glyoxalase/bleomycin resistance protein/dioxygenase [Parafrankia sp. EUN1f]